MPTSSYGLPYPSGTTDPDVPRDIQALVDALGPILPPIGTEFDYSGAADPPGGKFMLEDGRAISRTTYAALFALIGTTYGAGNGTTTFNIPDMRGRVRVHSDNMGSGAAGRLTSANARGNVAGAEAHHHTNPNHQHSFEIDVVPIPQGGGSIINAIWQINGASVNGSQASTNTDGGTTSGDSSSMPPYQVSNAIIRVL